MFFFTIFIFTIYRVIGCTKMIICYRILANARISHARTPIFIYLPMLFSLGETRHGFAKGFSLTVGTGVELLRDFVKVECRSFPFNRPTMIIVRFYRLSVMLFLLIISHCHAFKFSPFDTCDVIPYPLPD